MSVHSLQEFDDLNKKLDRYQEKLDSLRRNHPNLVGRNGEQGRTIPPLPPLPPPSRPGVSGFSLAGTESTSGVSSASNSPSTIGRYPTGHLSNTGGSTTPSGGPATGPSPSASGSTPQTPLVLKKMISAELPNNQKTTVGRASISFNHERTRVIIEFLWAGGSHQGTIGSRYSA